MRSIRLASAAAALLLAGCGSNYSPNTYASNAVQQANKVDQGVVVGVRKVDISAQPTTGTVTGAAVGGIAGAQVGQGVTTALTSLGGTVIGGLVGSAAEHTAEDTSGYEYIVRKTNGELVSVTQKDATPLEIGQKVLVIAGNQARIVVDYTVPAPAEAAKADKPATAPAADAKPAVPPAVDAKPAVPPAVDAKPAVPPAGPETAHTVEQAPLAPPPAEPVPPPPVVAPPPAPAPAAEAPPPATAEPLPPLPAPAP